MDQTVAPTSFLWGAYYPNRYYYEVREMQLACSTLSRDNEIQWFRCLSLGRVASDKQYQEGYTLPEGVAGRQPCRKSVTKSYVPLS